MMSDHSDFPSRTPRIIRGEELTDRCPICGQLNFVGEADDCEHFFACELDGDLIWNSNYEDFVEVWSVLCDAIEENRGFTMTRINEASKRLGLPVTWMSGIEQDASAKDFLYQKFKFQFGETTATDGMLSGEGRLVYHEKTELVERFMSSLIEIAGSLDHKNDPK
jgi:hypothetical protein